uniref:NADH dehydrogenase subunit 6 n=1 Tax=Mesohomotoma hibisci TaxID=399243 RepID=A0A344A2K5_9HEMI|nr:NADH dehydrogenase subunit 6 [Mesohomotoma hibisci]
MLKIMMLILIMVSSMMTQLMHPFTLSFLILIQTILITSFTRILCNSSWISLTLFLIMVGGLMIIFMYTTSICSNQRFSNQMSLSNYFYMVFMLPVLMVQNNFLFKTDYININNFMHKEFYKLFSSVNIWSSMFMFLYLMLTLLVMIKLMNFSMGPMRKKY